jgi:alpha-beta hydrolase superfamily lysophospholipase
VRPIDPTSVGRQPVATEDGEGELDLYFIPSHGEVPALAETTVVYNHGNYAGLEHYQPRIRYLHEAGYAVLAWDYRGYGKSLPETSPTGEQFFADARQIRELADEIVPDPDRIIVYANSLGSLPAIEMAQHAPGCALFLEAPFVSLSAAARSNSTLSFGESFFSAGRFDAVENIAGHTAPVFLMQGSLDNKFPIEEAERLLVAAAGPTDQWVLEGVRHGISNLGVPEAGLSAYMERMRAFLDQHAPACLGP